jgi:hypothetical protein
LYQPQGGTNILGAGGAVSGNGDLFQQLLQLFHKLLDCANSRNSRSSGFMKLAEWFQKLAGKLKDLL